MTLRLHTFLTGLLALLMAALLALAPLGAKPAAGLPGTDFGGGFAASRPYTVANFTLALEGRVGYDLDALITGAYYGGATTRVALWDEVDRQIDDTLALFGADRMRQTRDLLAILAAPDQPLGTDCPAEGTCFETAHAQARADLRSLGIVDLVLPYTWEGVAAELALAGGASMVRIGGRLMMRVGDDIVEVAAARATNRTTIETSNGALVRPTDSPNYSVAAEVQMPSSAYPGVSRQRHNQISNQALHEAFEADPAYAARMESLYPGIIDGVRPGPRGAYPRSAPTPDVTWHHGDTPGQMQLVPRDQHTASGPVQDSLHPDGSGGYSIWGTE